MLQTTTDYGSVFEHKIKKILDTVVFVQKKKLNTALFLYRKKNKKQDRFVYIAMDQCFTG